MGYRGDKGNTSGSYPVINGSSPFDALVSIKKEEKFSNRLTPLYIQAYSLTTNKEKVILLL